MCVSEERHENANGASFCLNGKVTIRGALFPAKRLCPQASRPFPSGSVEMGRGVDVVREMPGGGRGAHLSRAETCGRARFGADPGPWPPRSQLHSLLAGPHGPARPQHPHGKPGILAEGGHTRTTSVIGCSAFLFLPVNLCTMGLWVGNNMYVYVDEWRAWR